MKNWTESGYGVSLYNQNNDAMIAHFVCAFCDCSDEEELNRMIEEADYDGLQTAFDEPISRLIAAAINQMEGLTVFRGFGPDEESRQEWIGVGEFLPWDLQGEDAALTKAKADSIIAKYGAMLGIDEKPDTFTAYYGG